MSRRPNTNKPLCVVRRWLRERPPHTHPHQPATAPPHTYPPKHPTVGCPGCCRLTAVCSGSTAACGSGPWRYLRTTWWRLAGVFTPRHHSGFLVLYGHVTLVERATDFLAWVLARGCGGVVLAGVAAGLRAGVQGG